MGGFDLGNSLPPRPAASARPPTTTSPAVPFVNSTDLTLFIFLQRSEAGRRTPDTTQGVPPLVQPPARSGAKAAFVFSSLSDTERPPGVSLGAAGAGGRPSIEPA